MPTRPWADQWVTYMVNGGGWWQITEIRDVRVVGLVDIKCYKWLIEFVLLCVQDSVLIHLLLRLTRVRQNCAQQPKLLPLLRCSLRNTYDGRIAWNMTASTKPEMHNVSQCHQRRTEPRPVSVPENLAKFGRAVFEICERTDRQTDRQTDKQPDILITVLLSSHSCRGRSNNLLSMEFKYFVWNHVVL